MRHTSAVAKGELMLIFQFVFVATFDTVSNGVELNLAAEMEVAKINLHKLRCY